MSKIKIPLATKDDIDKLNEDLSGKLDNKTDAENKGKAVIVNEDGSLGFGEVASSEDLDNKLDNTTDVANKGKAVVVGEDGTLEFGDVASNLRYDGNNLIAKDDDGTETILYIKDKLKIVTWADGTDEEIQAMLEAHYQDEINIADYWAVGDVRNVNLAAMGASGITNSRNVAETHSAQVVQLVILDFEHDTLTTPINGHTKAAITVQTKDCLKIESNTNYQNENSEYDAGMGSMNNYSGTHTNSGGWKSSARRTWCNGQFINALPSTVKNIIKQVKIYTDNTGGGSDTASYVTATDDYAFLPAEWEIFGARDRANSAEKNYQTQYEYFKTAANRCKKPKLNSSSVSGRWWERSPNSGSSTSFCIVNGAGVTNNYYAGDTNGLAPAFCL